MADTMTNQPNDQVQQVDWSTIEAAMLFNNASGHSVAKDFADRLARSLTAHHAFPNVVPIEQDPDDFVGRMNAIREASPNLLVAIGGDGTVNAAATIAIEKNIPLLIVPAGTMDLVARDLEIPIRFDDFLSRYAGFRVRLIDYASVNDTVFLHSAHVGIVPSMSQQREAVREAETIADKFSAAQRMFFAATLADPLTLTLRSDHGTAQRSTRSLTVTCNALLEGPLGTHRRAALDSGQLGVFVSRHTGPAATPMLLASMLAGRTSEDLGIESATCSRLDVEVPHCAIDVGLDGEVRTLETPLHFKSHHRGLLVLAPAP